MQESTEKNPTRCHVLIGGVFHGRRHAVCGSRPIETIAELPDNGDPCDKLEVAHHHYHLRRFTFSDGDGWFEVYAHESLDHAAARELWLLTCVEAAIDADKNAAVAAKDRYALTENGYLACMLRAMTLNEASTASPLSTVLKQVACRQPVEDVDALKTCVQVGLVRVVTDSDATAAAADTPGGGA